MAFLPSDRASGVTGALLAGRLTRNTQTTHYLNESEI